MVGRCSPSIQRRLTNAEIYLAGDGTEIISDLSFVAACVCYAVPLGLLFAA